MLRLLWAQRSEGLGLALLLARQLDLAAAPPAWVPVRPALVRGLLSELLHLQSGVALPGCSVQVREPVG
jgi:hypothetical protein